MEVIPTFVAQSHSRRDVILFLSIHSFLDRNSRNIQNPTQILPDNSSETLDDSEAGIINTPNDDSNDISDSLNQDSLLVNDTQELIPQSSTNQVTSGTESDDLSNNDSGVHGTYLVWETTLQRFLCI